MCAQEMRSPTTGRPLTPSTSVAFIPIRSSRGYSVASAFTHHPSLVRLQDTDRLIKTVKHSAHRRCLNPAPAGTRDRRSVLTRAPCGHPRIVDRVRGRAEIDTGKKFPHCSDHRAAHDEMQRIWLWRLIPDAKSRRTLTAGTIWAAVDSLLLAGAATIAHLAASAVFPSGRSTGSGVPYVPMSAQASRMSVQP